MQRLRRVAEQHRPPRAHAPPLRAPAETFADPRRVHSPDTRATESLRKRARNSASGNATSAGAAFGGCRPHQSVVIALPAAAPSALRREALERDAAVRLARPDFRHQRDLPVVVLAARECRPRRRRRRRRPPRGARSIRGRAVAPPGSRRVRRRRRRHASTTTLVLDAPAGTRERRIERVLQRTIADDVAERGDALLAGVKPRAPEAAALRNVDAT